MTKPLITVAMATYDDFDGVYFSISALRMYQDMQDVEIVVLDNNPDGVQGKDVAKYVNSIKSHCQISYHPFTENTGTTQTRERLFSLAQGDVVLVMDSHVLLKAGAITKLKAFWASADADMKKNLFTGPLLYDNLAQTSSHFECDEFRSQMLGTWATAWVDPQGNYMAGRNFTDEAAPIKHELRMKPLMSDGPWMRSGIAWPGHEKVLKEKGFWVAGQDGDEVPFEVPGQGLGMFMSSKEHWLGFNKHFSSFGGEECYIHQKYRDAGRKTINLPFLAWGHRFYRPLGVPYPISNEGKLRNYILGFTELGLDLEPIRKHFVDETGVKQELFDLIVSDPVNFDPKNNKFYKEHPNTNLMNMQPVSRSNLGMDLPIVADNLHTIALHLTNIPRDLDKHAAKLMELASRCSSVAEITHRRESTAFLLAGLTRKQACGKEECQKPKKCENTCKGPVRMVSWQSERDTLIPMLLEAAKTSPGKPVTYTDHKISYEDALPDIQEQFDMLYLDAQTNESLAPKLEKYKNVATKFLVIHDVHGALATNKWVGMGKMAKAFLKDNPDWFLHYFEPNNYGIVVFSKDPDMKPAEPLAPWPKTLADGSPCGPGTFLKKFFESIGQYSSPTCTCTAKQQAMDKQGPQWCRDNIELILDGIKEEYDKRVAARDAMVAKAKAEGQPAPAWAPIPPFVRMAMKLVVYRCIRKAEKQLACGECS